MQLSRIKEVASVFAQEGLGYLTSSPSGGLAAGAEARPERAAASDAELAARLRRICERLGPTFVKFGQLLATRVDLFSAEFLAELGKLHAAVPPFPAATARAILEAELGCKIEDVFSSFTAEPVASASIAQVHRARLKDGDVEVAVKIQRPGLDESLAADLEVLLQVSTWLDRLLPAYRSAMVHLVAQEYAKRALMETDFTAEAEATEGFGELYANDPVFRIPAVYRRLSGRRVLVLQWMTGTRLDGIDGPEALRRAGLEPDEFARNLIRLQIGMAYEHGFVHGDTHPGNMFLQEGGAVALIDFGLNAHVPTRIRDKMLETLLFTAQGKANEAASAMVELFEPGVSVDQAKLKAELAGVIRTRLASTTITDYKISDELIAGIRITQKYKLTAQPALLMVIRNLAIVEGTVLKFAPEMPIGDEMAAVVKGIIARKAGPQSIFDALGTLLPQLLLTLSQRPRTAERLLKIERNFADSSSLGDFLRKEGVTWGEAHATKRPWPLIVLALVTGAAAGYFLSRW